MGPLQSGDGFIEGRVILFLSAAAPKLASTSRISLATYALLKTPVSNLVVDVQGKEAPPEPDVDITLHYIRRWLLGGWFGIGSYPIVGPTLV